MKNKYKLLLIRIAYWWGAIGDALLAIEMFFSALMGVQSPFTGLGLTIIGGVQYQYAMCLAATFMFGWTFLLIWADRKPIERKDIILLTLPIIVGIQISKILAYNFGLINFEIMLGYTIQRIIFLSFCVFCYFLALKWKQNEIRIV
ncbi:MAG: hypothetical protein EU539_02415 [Promethearchaeota archaeon]|nr:MAG: hypothetical protein EU539_02415 [Candidatus Lokiarchaeota archaeon]